MKVREHPKILDWPPQPGGTKVTAERPQAESQPILKDVHLGSVGNGSIPLSCEFKGNLFSYDVLTKDVIFEKRLAAVFSKYVGKTLEELGNLEIDF